MAKRHTYESDDDDVEVVKLEFEDRQVAMLKRCLDSIEDLLQEATIGETRLSIEQEIEMDNIIKDARVQRLLT